MIQSFDDAVAEEIFHGIYSHAVRKKFSSQLVTELERKLDLLNAAESLESLHWIPSIKAEAGVRDAHGKYSIPLDPNWRLAFGWNGGPEYIEIKPTLNP